MVVGRVQQYQVSVGQAGASRSHGLQYQASPSSICTGELEHKMCVLEYMRRQIEACFAEQFLCMFFGVLSVKCKMCALEYTRRQIEACFA
eukprot:1159491-Pelagomonas_calceolata.AAC.19